MHRSVGITAMGFYFPRYYVSVPELLKARGEPPDRAVKGLGIQRMALLASNEDSVTMAANAVESLEFPKERVGKLIFATECGNDSAKDNAVYIHDLCGLPKNCEAYDVKAACAASTYALWQVIDWILSGRANGKLGVIVCSDQAIYDYLSRAEITGGGGAVVLLVEENPQIISFDRESGDYKENVRDFWKPLANTCAIIAEKGKLSEKTYLAGLRPAFYDFRDKGGNTDFDFLVFHTPYKKMVMKAFNELAQIHPKIRGKFESMTGDSLKAPCMVGNIYNGSLYLALGSLLETKSGLVQGKNVGFYSFGSGSSSKFFRGTINLEFKSDIGLFNKLKRMKKISPTDYERIRCGEDLIEETNGFLFNGVDEQGYRRYQQK
ncbi:MAG: hydroxymethylglutaryl-CoA synthase family protein [Candidatus Helarchaeota archaeon]